LQSLARNLVDASSFRYGNILQKSAALSNVVNSHGADRMWGSVNPTDLHCPQDNYFYSPNVFQSERALKSAALHKKECNIGKSLGVVELTPKIKDHIKRQKLSLVATIPARAIHLFPSPFTKTPIKKCTTSHEMGIILAIDKENKTVVESEILLSLNILQNWKQNFCPTAVIHENTLVKELTDKRHEDFDLSSANWNKHITKKWEWIQSHTGTQGLLLQSDFLTIQSLKGSKKYNALPIDVALDLFKVFAKDWENKQALIPQHAKSWFHRSHHKKEKLKEEKRRKKAIARKQKASELLIKNKQIQQRKKLRFA
jgi:hypothetical protein